MKTLPKNYNHQETEARWQKAWEDSGIYHWQNNQPRENTFVIDTPPPTVSGLLHMGHIFSYTQADFVARYQRMTGKDVFYPMGFDDNGLPTERLVEKVKKKRAVDYDTREEFIAVCTEVSEEARQEFRNLFESVALSVDWNQEYHTISKHSRRTSQASFLDLYHKNKAYRQQQPMFWDPVDQTAIAQAEVEDKELDSHFCDIRFAITASSPLEGEQTNAASVSRGGVFKEQKAGVKGEEASFSEPLPRDEGYPNPSAPPSKSEISIPPQGGNDGKTIIIGTTRPELIPACVAIFYHPEDARYQHLKGKNAITPLFGVKVPILEDDTVEMDKGTGIMMCCTFGDEADIDKWKKHKLPMRVVLNQYGKMELEGKDWLNSNSPFPPARARCGETSTGESENSDEFSGGGQNPAENIPPTESSAFALLQRDSSTPPQGGSYISQLHNLKAAAARAKIIELLEASGDLVKKEAITHAVPCAERSGAPLEILPSQQWFVKILDEREALKAKAAECNWNPPYMKTRIDQWIDGLSWDWCISRQRYYGVPFPVWYSKRAGEEGKIIVADEDQLPVNPLTDLPKGYTADEVTPDFDVMDTWATSSVSPQINSHWAGSPLEGEQTSTEGVSRGGAFKEPAAPSPSRGANADHSSTLPPGESYSRHNKLFPADLRPQAHEIIRTWAFYTIVKAHLHEDTIPWKNLMISGWCLASDKTKMSKSKGNVVTPVALIEEKGADVVRYWASTSRLGADTAYSEDVLKIGKKLVNKLWNASKFAAIQLENLTATPSTAAQDVENGIITETLDQWILSRLHRAIKAATAEFDKFEYCKAREHIEDFFWNDFCDNYLEMVKKRAYGEGLEFSSPLPPKREARGATSEGEQTSTEGVSRGGASGEQITPPPSRGANADHSSTPPPGGSYSQKQSAIFTIYHCLDGVLRLFAPFVPHVAEELYSHIFDDKAAGSSLHAAGSWPKTESYPSDAQAEQAGIAACQILDVVRKLKAERNVSIKYPLDRLTISPPPRSEISTPPQVGSEGDSANNSPSMVESESHSDSGGGALQSIFRDLANVTNASEVQLGEVQEGTETEDKQWKVSAIFAESSEADAA